MKFAASLITLAVFVAGAIAQATINTPMNVVVCQPTLITWEGGSPPYTVSLTNGTPGAPAIDDLASGTSDTQLTWVCNQPIGTQLGLNLRDRMGAIYQSAPFIVQQGDASCLTASSSASSGSSTSEVSTSTSVTLVTSISNTTATDTTSVGSPSSGTITTSTSVLTTPAPTSSRTSSSSSRSSSGSNAGSSPSPSTTPNSAGFIAANTGVAGFVGALAALVLA